jgi:hypothetical protein
MRWLVVGLVCTALLVLTGVAHAAPSPPRSNDPSCKPTAAHPYPVVLVHGMFVDQVLADTGASKVDLVGHSQGGMMPRYWTKFDGGASKVDDLIGIAPSNHGTTNPLVAPAGTFCPTCAQQAPGSPFITDLNAGGDTQPGPSCTVISTRYDRGGHPVPVAGSIRPVQPGDERHAAGTLPVRH